MSGFQGNTGWSQADLRRPAMLTDQHGRQWSATIEKRSGFPCGLVSIAHRTPAGELPPWLPDQSYFVFSGENHTSFTIDYPRLLAERQKAHEDYHALAVDAAIAREWDVPERGHYPFKVTQIVGKPPHPLEPIAAAMQGNSWILGFTDTPDPRLVPFVQQATEQERLLSGLPDFSDLPSEEREDTPPVVQRNKGGRPRKVAEPLTVEG